MAWGSLNHDRRRELLEEGRARGRRQLEQMRQKNHDRTRKDERDHVQRL